MECFSSLYSKRDNNYVSVNFGVQLKNHENSGFVR